MDKKYNLAVILCDENLPVFNGETVPLKFIFRKFFTPVHFNISFFNAVQGELPDAKQFDACVLSGSKFSALDDNLWIKHLAKFIQAREYNKLIGICFGHQLIAQSLGGKVENVGWHIGVKNLNLVAKPSWMESAEDDLQCRFNHQDQVTQIPETAQLIASNDFCPNSVFSVENQIFCMQFHPEYFQSFHELMFSRYKDAFTEDERKAIKSNLTQPTNHDVVYQWILSFLNEQA